MTEPSLQFDVVAADAVTMPITHIDDRLRVVLNGNLILDQTVPEDPEMTDLVLDLGRDLVPGRNKLDILGINKHVSGGTAWHFAYTIEKNDEVKQTIDVGDDKGEGHLHTNQVIIRLVS